MSESADIEGLEGLEAIEGEVIHLDGGTVETVEAVTVRIQQGGANRILATEVELRQAAAGRIDAESVVVQQSAVIAARGDEIGAEQSFVGGVVAQDVRLHASRIGLTIADTVQLDQSSTLILLAREVRASARWIETHKGHRRLVELADAHYTRQQPGTNQACRPGKNFVLLLDDGSAASVAVVAAIMGAMALTGRVFEYPPAYWWGEGTPMATVTSIILLVSGCGILKAAWEMGRRRSILWPMWVPVVVTIGASAIVVLTVGVVGVGGSWASAVATALGIFVSIALGVLAWMRR